jgi:hypothetical protein
MPTLCIPGRRFKSILARHFLIHLLFLFLASDLLLFLSYVFLFCILAGPLYASGEFPDCHQKVDGAQASRSFWADLILAQTPLFLFFTFLYSYLMSFLMGRWTMDWRNNHNDGRATIHLLG